ncbi:MAG: YdeI/OmpD-associated family protein [Bacteroidota bacterium]
MNPDHNQIPQFFPTPADFRAWLAAHHATEQVLWVGYYKKKLGRPSMDWSESVDQALCFGWIDGLRHTIDAFSYKIRFTPRRSGSVWSAVNVRKIEALKAAGLMMPAGLKAFEACDPAAVLAEAEARKNAALSPEYLAQLETHPVAWNFWEALAPSYRRQSAHWVMSAKRPSTKDRRFEILLECCAMGQKIPAIGGKKLKPR